MVSLLKLKSYKGFTGQWSKYGGARQALIAVNQHQEDLITPWYCQSCGLEYPKVISPYKVQLAEDEYIRVCPICFAESWKEKILSRI